MTAVKLCGIMANDNERTADGADNGNGNNDSTQKVDEMLPNEMNRDDMPEQPGHDEAQTFPPIVNALLTYVVSIMKNATNPRLVEVISKYFSSDEIKDAKSILCDASNVEFKNRADSQNRSVKIAHVNDIVDQLRKLDRSNAIPFFVVDAAGLPRINAEDISYVVVNEKLTDMFNKMEVMNDAIAANTCRSTNNKQHIEKMSQHNQYAKAVTNTLDSDYPDVHGSMTRRGAYNRQNHSMPPPRGPPPLQSRARSSPYAPVTMSGPNPRSNFRMAPFVTQPNVQPTHDAQPNVQPTHDTQPNVQPTHNAQPNVQSTHVAQPPTSTSEAVGSASADPAVSANGDDSTSNTTRSVTESNNNNEQEHAPDGGHHPPGDAPRNDQQQDNRLTSKDDQRHDLSRASSHTSLNSIDCPQNNWQLQRQYRRNLSRQPPKRMEGTASVSNVKGAPQGTRDMFVYRVTQDTSDEALLSWIRKQRVNIIDFVKTSHVDSKYKSFKVTFNMSDYFYLYNPELWPSGVCIGRYLPPKPKLINRI